MNRLLSALPPNCRLRAFLLPVLLGLPVLGLFHGCRQAEVEPKQTMTLTATIDGKEWKAAEFLVLVEAADGAGDEHLWISAQDPTTLNSSKDLDLFIYDYKKTGSSTVDNSKNSRQKNGVLSFTDISKGISIDYWGPITYTLTKVEGDRYQGTFSGTLCAYLCLTTVPPVQIQGSFDVHIGVQAPL